MEHIVNCEKSNRYLLSKNQAWANLGWYSFWCIKTNTFFSVSKNCNKTSRKGLFSFFSIKIKLNNLIPEMNIFEFLENNNNNNKCLFSYVKKYFYEWEHLILNEWMVTRSKMVTRSILVCGLVFCRLCLYICRKFALFLFFYRQNLSSKVFFRFW